MGSRQSESHALAERCRKAGWRVEKATTGFKVYTPDNRMVPIHLTYSDTWSLKNNTQQLERLGLKEAEAKMAELRFSAREQAMDEADRIVAKKTAAARKRADDPLKRAAGPYLTEPEDVLITWFAEKHPAPWQRWVYITPEIASYLLKNHNATNRPLNANQVEHYRRIILSGQWRLTHQGIAMDTDGQLQDGQHRLESVVSAGLSTDDPDLRVPFSFTVGMPVDNFKAIDEGLLRTAAQLFTRGGEKNGSTLQTAIRMVIAYKDPQYNGFRMKMPNGLIVDQFSEDPESFREAASHAQSNYRKYKTSAGAIAATMYLIKRACGSDNVYVEAFFDGLRTGRKSGTRFVLDDDDPRAVYRETMERLRESAGAKRKMSARDQMAMIILSWNNIVNNHSPRYMRYSDDNGVPRIVVCHDSGPRASACPEKLRGEVEGEDE